MKKNVLRKGLAFVVIFLFIGACIVPNISGKITQKNDPIQFHRNQASTPVAGYNFWISGTIFVYIYHIPSDCLLVWDFAFPFSNNIKKFITKFTFSSTTGDGYIDIENLFRTQHYEFGQDFNTIHISIFSAPFFNFLTGFEFHPQDGHPGLYELHMVGNVFYCEIET